MRNAFFALTLAPVVPLMAQRNPGDTARSLDAVVVTAERARAPLSSSIGSVTRLSAGDLARTPRATLADLLRLAPGFAVIDFDGLGFDPQVMTRGFYGGGEAEYVAVLVDGRAVNQLQTGVVAWDALPPLASIESIEIIRGSASPLYGDAAVGGVINVITRSAAKSARFDITGGTFGNVRGTFDGSLSSIPLTLGAALERTDGYRAHAERMSTRANVSHSFFDEADRRLSLTARAYRRTFDEPGPLLESLMSADRAASDPLFRFDHTTDDAQSLTLDGGRRVGTSSRLSGSVGAERRAIDAVRTLALAPGFGDTKLRHSTALRGGGEAQLEVGDTSLPGTESFVFGAALSHGALDSRYHDVAAGPRAAYAAATGDAGPARSSGKGGRTIGSLHAQYNLLPSSALRINVGGRFDALLDNFRPTDPADGSVTDATHTAFSPRVGANLRYVDRADVSGNAYVTISRSFKAPTLDQLYDLRTIPIPFPPFEIRTSNPDLKPQSGTNVEAGVYQGVRLSPSVRASGSVSAYQMRMKNELDFDVASFKYINIGQSRHRGGEAAIRIEMDRGSLFGNFTLQDATSQSGANAGKRLKAIPQSLITGGASARVAEGLDVSLVATSVGGMYIDDANTSRIPDYTRIDAHASVDVRGMKLFADVRNLFGARYSSSGFVDPAGSGEAYWYPAAGMVFEVGLRRGW